MPVAREEFHRLSETIDNGFQGINTRLDRLNDRTHKVEISDTELRVRLTTNEGRLVAIEEAVFDRQDHRHRPEDPSATKRESALVILGAAVMMLLIKLAFLFGTAVLDLVKAGLKLK